MDNLEEKLRDSRRKERPDLRPPAGGWEAVQAGLVASAAAAATGAAAGKTALAAKASAGTAAAGTAAAGAATVAGATAAKASLAALVAKAIIGVTVLGGVVAGGYAVVTSGEAGDTTEPTTINHQPSATDQSAAPDLLPAAEATSGEATSEAADPGLRPVQTEAGTPSTSSPADDLITPVQRAVSPPPPDRNIAEGASLPAAQRRSSAGAAPGITPTPSPVSGQVNAPAQRPPAPGNQPAGTTPPPANEASSPTPDQPATGPSTVPAGIPLSTPAAPDTTTRLPGFAATGEMDDGGTLTEQAATNPTGAVTEQHAVTAEVAPVAIANINIPARAIPIPGTEYVPFALEAEVVPEEVRFSKFRRAEWSAWQVHGGANVFFGSRNTSPRGNNILRRTTDNNVTDRITLPSGEEVDLTNTGINSFVFNDRYSTNVAYRLGVTRQTRWGGTLRATLNHYRTRNEDRREPGIIADDEVFFRTAESERATFLDLEFQYTLFRRRRLRPFVGLGTVLASTYSFEETETFFDGQTQTSGTRTGQQRSVPFSTNPDLTVSAGFQYQVSNRLSLGGQVWGNFGASELLLDAPFGLEARYTLE